jgi:hypothetical protein
MHIEVDTLTSFQTVRVTLLVHTITASLAPRQRYMLAAAATFVRQHKKTSDELGLVRPTTRVVPFQIPAVLKTRIAAAPSPSPAPNDHYARLCV